ncbi:tRNA (N(6)-L-threonylcarbamoyladenosine(37)-C(2))-methylthiotransferase [Candidatus Woesearchaeota archaeon]|nr:tRNA (N(6)-L-threonylcarbamoyladenosine(37)-C(2))-methylthiotransferase [Candidatus Woesearchaeota archaeon]
MQKICIQTFGCAANAAEGEMMKGLLNKEGNEIVEKKNADVIVLNLCTVKGNAVALKAVKTTRQKYPDKKIVIAGCVSQELIPQLKLIVPEASIINTHNINKITTAVEQPIEFLERTQEHKINLPRVRKNPVIGILPISTGCDSACTFCSVKFIKGAHVSYQPEKIISEVEHCINEGCKEIWLTGQDTSCYGMDFAQNLPWLLNKICEIEGDFKIRLGMANPKHVKNYADELIQVYKSEKMFKFLHLPLQSANNKILTEMKRGYTTEEFKNIATKFRKEFPEITLSTDIICGFPNETKEQFDETLNMMNELQFDIINISRFAPRHGTLAARMQGQVSSNEKKQRSKKLTETFRKIALEQNKKWTGWQGKIIIDERAKHDAFIGRNYAYKLVVVHGDYELGQTIDVKITNAESLFLRGEIL